MSRKDDRYEIVNHEVCRALEKVHVLLKAPSHPISAVKGLLTYRTSRPAMRAEVECFRTVDTSRRQVESAGFGTRLEKYLAQKMEKHFDGAERDFLLDLEVHVGRFSAGLGPKYGKDEYRDFAAVSTSITLAYLR